MGWGAGKNITVIHNGDLAETAPSCPENWGAQASYFDRSTRYRQSAAGARCRHLVVLLDVLHLMFSSVEPDHADAFLQVLHMVPSHEFLCHLW